MIILDRGNIEVMCNGDEVTIVDFVHSYVNIFHIEVNRLEMPSSKFKVYVKARFEVVWAKLLDKIHHPEKYVEGIKSVEILEETNNHILRLIRFDNPTWQELKELIVYDQTSGFIVYRLVDHPFFTGETINICRTTNEIYHSELEYEINWTLKNDHHESNEEKDLSQKALQLAIQQMKIVSEEAEAVYK